ncbi:MAG: inositol 2-dehydrogenase, partial [Gammaproteobacteria bacterium]|nr:inositol 2-dehydrogenase [Gammaproteobacteria bacterium]
GDVDTAIINLVTENGKLAQISNSRRANFGYDQRLEVHGSEGMLSAQNVNEHNVVKHNSSGVISARPEHFFLQRYEAAYQNEIDSFICSLRGEQVELPTMEDGLQALLLAEAAELSVRQGRSINLSEL